MNKRDGGIVVAPAGAAEHWVGNAARAGERMLLGRRTDAGQSSLLLSAGTQDQPTCEAGSPFPEVSLKSGNRRALSNSSRREPVAGCGGWQPAKVRWCCRAGGR